MRENRDTTREMFGCASVILALAVGITMVILAVGWVL